MRIGSAEILTGEAHRAQKAAEKKAHKAAGGTKRAESHEQQLRAYEEYQKKGFEAQWMKTAAHDESWRCQASIRLDELTAELASLSRHREDSTREARLRAERWAIERVMEREASRG